MAACVACAEALQAQALRVVVPAGWRCLDLITKSLHPGHLLLTTAV